MNEACGLGCVIYQVEMWCFSLGEKERGVSLVELV